MALVEERVKSTLQGLQAMIKASEAQDAGAGCWWWEDFWDSILYTELPSGKLT